MFLSAYSQLKEIIGTSLHLAPDALHVHVGLILFLAGAALMRSERRFIYALAWLLAVCVVGEIFDLSNDLAKGYSLRWLNSAKDIVNTMFWPTLCVMAGPLVSRVLRLRSSPYQADVQDEGK